MAPEVVEEAMRAYAQETDRLNRERRANGDAWRTELTRVEKQIAQIVEAIAEPLLQSDRRLPCALHGGQLLHCVRRGRCA